MHYQPPPPLYDDGTTMTTTSSTQLNHDNDHNTKTNNNNNKTTTTSPTIMNQHWLNSSSSTPKTISSYQLQHMLHTDPLNVLILDCRSHQSHFNKSHILTALHCGSLHNNNNNNNNNNNKMKNDHEIDETNAKQLENEFLSFQDRIFFRQREFVDTIVLYTSVSPPPSLLNNNNINNNNNDDMSNHAIGECLDKKSHSKMNNIPTNNSTNNDIDVEDNEVEWQCMTLLVNAMKEEQLNEKIYILEHGFTHFQTHCPLYCEYNYNDKRSMMDSVSGDDTASHHHRHSDAVTSDDDNDEKTNRTNDENGNSHHHQMKSVVHCMSKKQRLQLCHKRLFGSFTHKMSCESPSKLLPFLYLGSAQNSFNLDQMKQLNISCIVNMALEVENFYPELFHYIKCDLLDDETADVSIHFEETFQFIERARKNRQRILIACFMGMSRSASVSIAYIMRAKRWTMKKSYMFVKKQRPIININSAFMYQLMSYEVSLFGESSFPMIFKSSACHSLCHHTNLNKGIDDDEKEINISKSESNDSKVLKDNQPTTPLPSKSIQVSDSMNILLS